MINIFKNTPESSNAPHPLADKPTAPMTTDVIRDVPPRWSGIKDNAIVNRVRQDLSSAFGKDPNQPVAGAGAGSMTPESMGAFNADPAIATQGFKQGMGDVSSMPTSHQTIEALAKASQMDNPDIMSKSFESLQGSQNPSQLGAVEAGTLPVGAAVLGILLSSGVIKEELKRQPGLMGDLVTALKHPTFSAMQSGLAELKDQLGGKFNNEPIVSIKRVK